MKNLLLSSAFILTLCSAAFAQVEFGLKVGPLLSRNYVSVGDTIAEFSDAKISFLAGGFIRMPIGSGLGIQAELLFSRKGNKSRNFDYVSMPLMLQYEFFPNLRAEAGAEVGYLLGIDDGIFRGIFEKYPFNRRLDVGLNAGLSYHFLDRLNVGLRYNLGVYDIFRVDTTSVFGFPSDYDLDVKNHTLQLSVGYRLK